MIVVVNNRSQLNYDHLLNFLFQIHVMEWETPKGMNNSYPCNYNYLLK